MTKGAHMIYISEYTSLFQELVKFKIGNNFIYLYKLTDFIKTNIFKLYWRSILR